MIPSVKQAKVLWETYQMPESIRNHVTLVAKVAVFLARGLQERGIKINISLVEVAALLHDLDKVIEKLPGEQHPDAGVRILRKEGMNEVADIVLHHPVHAILQSKIAPKTWEAKVVFLADKMVKQEIITVDERFSLWEKEKLPSETVAMFAACYPKVKKLEQEILGLLGIKPEDVAKRA